MGSAPKRMKPSVFEGVCTALITPFTDDGQRLDLDGLDELLDRQVRGGVAAVLLAGTTGESPTLSQDEYETLLRHSVQYLHGRLPVLAAIGGNHTEACLRRARLAQDVGVDAVLVTLPYYNKSTAIGRREHCLYIADHIDLPVILYNVPGRTLVGLSAEDYVILSRHARIVGVKEASPDASLWAHTVAACGDHLTLYSGNDDCLLPMAALGARGVISVASNLLPAQMVDFCKACLAGSHEQARSLYTRYAPLFQALFHETNPIPIKTAMELAGLPAGALRRPLLPAAPDTVQKLRSCLAALA